MAAAPRASLLFACLVAPARPAAPRPQADEDALYKAGPMGEGNTVVMSPPSTQGAEEMFGPTDDGGMVLSTASETSNGLAAIIGTNNDLGPPQGPEPLPYVQPENLGYDMLDGERAKVAPPRVT